MKLNVNVCLLSEFSKYTVLSLIKIINTKSHVLKTLYIKFGSWSSLFHCLCEKLYHYTRFVSTGRETCFCCFSFQQLITQHHSFIFRPIDLKLGMCHPGLRPNRFFILVYFLYLGLIEDFKGGKDQTTMLFKNLSPADIISITIHKCFHVVFLHWHGDRWFCFFLSFQQSTPAQFFHFWAIPSFLQTWHANFLGLLQDFIYLNFFLILGSFLTVSIETKYCIQILLYMPNTVHKD